MVEKFQINAFHCEGWCDVDTKCVFKRLQENP